MGCGALHGAELNLAEALHFHCTHFHISIKGLNCLLTNDCVWPDRQYSILCFCFLCYISGHNSGCTCWRRWILQYLMPAIFCLSSEQQVIPLFCTVLNRLLGFKQAFLYFLCVFSCVSILGMHLFGCKFGSERDGDTLPDRKNFDSLLWAIVTVFQVSIKPFSLPPLSLSNNLISLR